jgi:hypothetical protein
LHYLLVQFRVFRNVPFNAIAGIAPAAVELGKEALPASSR